MLKRKAVSAVLGESHYRYGYYVGMCNICTCIAGNTYLYNHAAYLCKTDRARIAYMHTTFLLDENRRVF